MELIEIARLEEARQALGLAEIADESRPFGGGTAGRGVAGSWINNVVGAAMNGPVDAAALDNLIEWYASAGIEPRLEVAPFADPGLIALLEERRFVVRMFENVFYRELDVGSVVRAPQEPPVELSIGILNPADAAVVREAALVAISGFFPPGAEPRESDIEMSERALRHPRTVAVVARVGGRAVGAGSMEVSGGVCGLFGLSVLPEFRRRGIQQALIAARLNEAAKRGARLATIGSKPGVATERNVRRMGFALAYTKVVLVQPGPGRAPVIA